MTPRPAIQVRGARQNNLKGVDLDLPLGELHVVTGVSGSGKSSLAFDTVYSEGQRRYVETFSSYARQFLDRMDKPRFDDAGGIDGIPPSIAIDQTNPVRTSRSTVGTMTELNDHLKLLFARAAVLHCRGCGAPVRRDTPRSIMSAISEAGLDRIMITFDVAVPAGSTPAEIVELLAGQGYTRVHREHPDRIEVIADRLRLGSRHGPGRYPDTDHRSDGAAAGCPDHPPGNPPGGGSIDNPDRHPHHHTGGDPDIRSADPPHDDPDHASRRRAGSDSGGGIGADSDSRARAVEAIESALKAGRGRLTVYRLDAQRHARSPRRFSITLHCAGCDIEYREPVPSMFSFNSPLGACETCRGFGRTMGIDYGLVISDESKTLSEGAIRPWLSKSYRQCQRDLVRYARRRGVALDRAWRELDATTREWVLEGEAGFDEDGWYGVRRFFDWLETKSYRMHIRVLLSRYRAYRECPACHGARLKPQALLWRIGTRTGARKALGGDAAHRPPDATLDTAAFEKLPGLCIRDAMRLPLDRCRKFFDELRLRAPLDEATELLLAEIRGRLDYLVEVGLGYLTLDRQSRTLSGGEVQRINLTTALGTSLVNTLFVLDEPSIGLHARDIARIVSVLHKLREAGNTLLVVEHDPQIMLAADRIIDMGPGPGERGGEIVFRGTPRALLRSRRSLTAAWLRGERRIEPRAPAPTEARRADRAAEPNEPRAPSPTPALSERIEIRGARAHNLAEIDVDLPLRRFVCVTGVSGSGKSTLAVDVLHRAACKRLGRAVEAPGAHRTIHGLEALDDVVLVDQSPIGKTTRSNPASYVGALDAIRKRFAAEPIAIERGYTAGTFSFNSSNGRCPSCGGNGFEHIEMQFLSDVYLRCPDCDGRRYRSEVLDVKIRPQGGSRADTGEVGNGSIGRTSPGRSGGGIGSIRPISGRQGATCTSRGRSGDGIGTVSGNAEGDATARKLDGGPRAGDGAGGGAGGRIGGSGSGAGKARDGDTARALDAGIGDGARAATERFEGGTTRRRLDSRNPDGGTRAEDGAGAGAPRSIAGVLEMTVEDTLTFFAGCPDVVRPLAPLVAVGLGYLRLGQPVPALSGGEAQRLKLARHLAARGAGHCLFIFDEPTTGLHLEDVSRLLEALDALLAAGHSVLVIEHHLDVIAAADWIVDLGPEGGSGGGRVVATGRPGVIARRRRSHTGAALRAHFAERQQGAAPPAAAPARKPSRGGGAISIRNAREHNLHGADIDIPRDRFTVITGVSGSGKSTVAFDILFAEGQRRYLESLNAYARQFVQPAARPDVDAIFGIPPSVAIEQRTSRGGYKSTVGTMTEIHHFLRLLFVRLGTQHCPECEIAIEPQTLDAIVDRVLKRHRGREVEVLAPLVVARKGYYTELARWAARHGHAALRVDGEPLPTDAWPRLDRYREHDIDLPLGAVTARADREPALRAMIERALGHGAGRVRVSDRGEGRGAGRADDRRGGRRTDRGGDLDGDRSANRRADGSTGRGDETLYSTARACPGCGRSFDELDPRLFSYNSRHGWCPSCYGTGREIDNVGGSGSGKGPRASSTRRRTPPGNDETTTGKEPPGPDFTAARECRACAGRRLRPEALAVRYRSRSIADFSALAVEAARAAIAQIRPRGREAAIARDVLAEIGTRFDFLCRLGLGYLRLDRAAPTLSGGEAQRIRLAAQLGSNLRGVCYILDEPTIGLHARDNAMLLETLRALRAKGNTVVVVEHDEETIRSAEHIIDLGPGAGVNGGRVVAHGSIARILASPDSLTGRYLASPLAHPLPGGRSPERTPTGAPASERRLSIRSARLNNLRDIDVDLPLERLVCVTGVSGSGKSSLVRGVLLANLAPALRAKRRGRPEWTGCREIRGFEALSRVMEVDQTPIGKTPRSCPATYVGIWDPIRRLFAGATESRIRGYGASRFSFNVAGGRCDACEGQGVQRIEMSFLPDVRVLCDACGGQRFTPETLEIRYLDMSIAEVLGSSVDEALPRFEAHPRIHRTLALLHDVGLGYLTLGQSSPTLSGGEAQRIKLVTELAKVDASATRRAADQALYVLDEPTIGLHMADVEKLVRVLHRLVDAGNTVVVIEHNLDVVAEADVVIDLGPEGGAGGGSVIAAGPPDEIAGTRGSHTARALSKFLTGRR